MKNLRTKTLSLLMALCFLAALIPLPTAAAEDNNCFPFQDAAGSWYANAVLYVTDRGLMNGSSATKFEPNAALTRAMFVTILGRMEGIDPAQYNAADFPDVKPDQWYTPYIAWAAEHEIVQGYNNGLFGTNDPITREQMGVMIVRYIEANTINLPVAEDVIEAFKDAATVASWAIDGLELMRYTGLLRGDSNGYFHPKQQASRAEAATLFMRLATVLGYYPPTAEAYAVTSITVDANARMAAVEVATVDACKLTLQILDDSGNTLLTTASRRLSAGLNGQTVSVLIPLSSLPRYFTVTATLTGTEALCDTFVCNTYTKAFEEFQALTIHDFSDQTVLRFDEQENDNFAVLRDDVIEIFTPPTSFNDETGIYKFAADSTITALNPGDKIAVYIDAQPSLLCIESIKTSGSTTTITAGETEPESFFDVIKINLKAHAEVPNDKPLSLRNPAKREYLTLTTPDFTASADVTVNPSVTKTYTVNIMGTSVSFQTTNTLSLTVRYAVGKLDDLFFSIIHTQSNTYSLAVSATVGAGGSIGTPEKQTHKLGTYVYPLGTTGLFAESVLSLQGGVSASASGKVSYTETKSSGFIYNAGARQSINASSSGKPTLTVEGEANIFVGVDYSIGVSFLKVLTAQIGITAGVEVVAKNSHVVTNEDSKHACEQCLTIEFGSYFNLYISLTAGIDRFSVTLFEQTLLGRRITIATFYFSIKNAVDSVHKGKATLGTGECPNISWRVFFEPQDDKGAVQWSASVQVSGKSGVVSTGTGRYDDYLLSGSYTANAEHGEASGSTQFTVSSKPRTVVIELVEEEEEEDPPEEPSEAPPEAFPDDGYGDNGRFLAPIERPDEDSIPISNRAELEAINKNLNGKYHLVCDISLSGAEWVPIGTEANPFTGVLDGQGYVISGMRITQYYENCGLFGYSKEAVILNVGIEKSSINITKSVSSHYDVDFPPPNDHTSIKINAGGLCGFAYESSISNCYHTGNVQITVTTFESADAYEVNEYGVMSASLASSVVNAGGLTGCADTPNFNFCYNTGTITVKTVSESTSTSTAFFTDAVHLMRTAASGTNSVSYSIAGGICGATVRYVCTFYECYNWGNIAALADAKGDASAVSTTTGGDEIFANTPSLFGGNNIADATAYAGGIIGLAYGPTIEKCDNMGNISATSVSVHTAYGSSSGTAPYNVGHVRTTVYSFASSEARAGGILGTIPIPRDYYSISECTNTGDIRASTSADSLSTALQDLQPGGQANATSYSHAYAFGTSLYSEMDCSNSGTLTANASANANALPNIEKYVILDIIEYTV